jgi:glycosyltransferase involved in cell wall biosynthesis
MEAMSSGVAVLASRLTGIPELVRDGETGLLADPRDADGIAHALRRLHEDPAMRSRLAAAGRSLVQREFDIRRNAAALVERIERAVAR